MALRTTKAVCGLYSQIAKTSETCYKKVTNYLVERDKLKQKSTNINLHCGK